MGSPFRSKRCFVSLSSPIEASAPLANSIFKVIILNLSGFTRVKMKIHPQFHSLKSEKSYKIEGKSKKIIIYERQMTTRFTSPTPALMRGNFLKKQTYWKICVVCERIICFQGLRGRIEMDGWMDRREEDS